MKLTDYNSKEEFIKACADLHKDENDPEYMFQSYENIPQSMCNESFISSYFWQVVNATKEMTEETLEAFNIWVNLKEYNIEDYIEKGYDIGERFSDSWRGKFETITHYAVEILEEQGYFDCISNEDIRKEIFEYFDHEKYGNNLIINDYIDYDNEHVFINLDRGSN